MHSLLVVDDQEIFRTPLCEALRDQGYEVREASTAPAALELAMRRKPDLVLLDLAMPNIDGFELLRYFRARAMFRSLPVIFLTAHARRDYLAQAAALGVRDYLLKSSFSISELVDRIRGQIGSAFPMFHSARMEAGTSPFASSPTPPKDDRPKAAPSRTKFLESVRLRAFPGVVEEILALAADPHASLSGIETVVRRDPALSAQIMVAANAPGILRGAPCSTLEDAIRLLGMTHVVRVVTSGAVMTTQDIASPWGLDLRRIWSHCLATGRICQRLHDPKHEAFGFLLGLLHELPELMAVEALGPQWESWKSQGIKYGWTTSTALGKAFECDFSELAQEVLVGMRLPEGLCAPLREHHAFFQAERPIEPRQEARTIEVAHQLASVLGRSGGELASVCPIRLEHTRPLHSPSTLGVDLIAMDTQIAHWEMSSGLGQDGISQVPSEQVSVLYWRSEEWFAPDPLEELLNRLSQCRRAETFGDLVAEADLKVVLAEPGTREWTEANRLNGRVLVFHRAQTAPSRGSTVRTLRLPTTEAAMVKILQDL